MLLLLVVLPVRAGYVYWFDDSRARVIYISYPDEPDRWVGKAKIWSFSYAEWLNELQAGWQSRYDYRDFAILSRYWEAQAMYFGLKDSQIRHLYSDCQYLRGKTVERTMELADRRVCLTCLARKAREE